MMFPLRSIEIATRVSVGRFGLGKTQEWHLLWVFSLGGTYYVSHRLHIGRCFICQKALSLTCPDSKYFSVPRSARWSITSQKIIKGWKGRISVAVGPNTLLVTSIFFGVRNMACTSPKRPIVCCSTCCLLSMLSLQMFYSMSFATLLSSWEVGWRDLSWSLLFGAAFRRTCVLVVLLTSHVLAMGLRTETLLFAIPFWVFRITGKNGQTGALVSWLGEDNVFESSPSQGFSRCSGLLYLLFFRTFEKSGQTFRWLRETLAVDTVRLWLLGSTATSRLARSIPSKSLPF